MPNIALPQHYFFSLFIFIFRKKNSAAVMLNVMQEPMREASHTLKTFRAAANYFNEKNF